MQQVLVEIQKIMLRDSHTKDVFRELDGFLILMSLLSISQERTHPPIVEPVEQVLSEVMESIRLIFVNLSEATNGHAENLEYFQVGFYMSTRICGSLILGRTLLAMIR